jgi:uracil-DNA glycosylase
VSDTRAGESFERLATEIRACSVCAPHLPLGRRPILRGQPAAELLIISQNLRSAPSH